MPTVGTKYIMKITNNRPSTYRVSWEITTTCNYSCWYCDDYYHNGKYKWPNLENTIEFFEELCSQHEMVHVDMGGGEPTLWPELHEFCKKKPSNLFIEITSNGSRTENWWTKNHSYFSNITISFHPKTAEVEHIKKVLSIIADGKKDVHSFMISDYDYIDKCLELYDWIDRSALPLSCNFKTLAPRIKDKDSRKKILEFKKYQDLKSITSTKRINRNTFSTKSKPTEAFLDGKLYDYNLAELRGENKYLGWKCSAGIKNLYISANGDLYRAACKISGKIGNMYFDTNLAEIKEITCDKPSCGCLDDLFIEKTND